MILNKIKSLLGLGSKDASAKAGPSNVTVKTVSSSKPQPSSSRGREEQGTVKFFNRKKGYGFIQANGVEKDVFVHITDTKGGLRMGDKVSFEVIPDGDGFRAKKVKTISRGKRVKSRR